MYLLCHFPSIIFLTKGNRFVYQKGPEGSNEKGPIQPERSGLSGTESNIENQDARTRREGGAALETANNLPPLETNNDDLPTLMARASDLHIKDQTIDPNVLRRTIESEIASGQRVINQVKTESVSTGRLVLTSRDGEMININNLTPTNPDHLEAVTLYFRLGSGIPWSQIENRQRASFGQTPGAGPLAAR